MPARSPPAAVEDDTSVPPVGNVIAVAPVRVPAKLNAPEIVTLPPMVIVDEPLFTPVPP